MSARKLLFILAALGGGACSDSSPPTTDVALAPAPRATDARSARERLTQSLARALADPGTRAAVKRQLDASNAPEGKLQFQALVRADQGALLATLARAGATSPGELLADLDAAHDLELYLPVPAQRAAWPGDASYLVGTIGSDGEIPVAFDADGTRHLLDPDTPPAVPVLALVPQETDFSRTAGSRIMGCGAACDDNPPPGGGAPGGSPDVRPASTWCRVTSTARTRAGSRASRSTSITSTGWMTTARRWNWRAPANEPAAPTPGTRMTPTGPGR